MNILTLNFYDGNIIKYEYQPEGKGGKGMILYDKQKGMLSIEKTAEEDANKYYGRMAQSKIEDIIKNRNLPVECIQAWY